MRLSPNLLAIRRCALGHDAHAIFTLLDLQIGDPAWNWRKPLVHVELAPARAGNRRLADRFRAVLRRWMDVQHAHIAHVFDVAQDDPLYALVEYSHGPTLAAIFDRLSVTGRRLPRSLAELMVAQLEQAHGVLAAAGLAHGCWAAHIIVERYGLKLVPWAWWDERATPDGDRPLLASLSEVLLDHAAPEGPAPTAEHLWALAIELCGDREVRWEPA